MTLRSFRRYRRISKSQAPAVAGLFLFAFHDSFKLLFGYAGNLLAAVGRLLSKAGIGESI